MHTLPTQIETYIKENPDVFMRCWDWIESMPSRGTNKNALREILEYLQKNGSITADEHVLITVFSPQIAEYAKNTTLLSKAISDLRQVLHQVSNLTLKGGAKSGGWNLTLATESTYTPSLSENKINARPLLESLINKLKDGSLIRGTRKLLVMGDIAFDHSFKCRNSPSGFAARHSNEELFDIEEDGDDYGAVGGCANTTKLFSSFGFDAELITVMGNDAEGMRVISVLENNGVHGFFSPLTGVQTITRLRFFIRNPQTGAYDLRYRMNKEPNHYTAQTEALKLVKSAYFLDKFSDLLHRSDILYINDTDKGFLTADTMEIIAPIITDWSQQRRRENNQALVIVDPKFEWQKYSKLPVTLIKCNLREVCRVLGFAGNHEASDTNLNIIKQLPSALENSRVSDYQNIVVTLGDRGAAHLQRTRNKKTSRKTIAWTADWFAPFPVDLVRFRATTGAGDLFGAGLTIALLANLPLNIGIIFGNYLGALQCMKITGECVNVQDILNPQDLTNFLTTCPEPVNLTGWHSAHGIE